MRRALTVALVAVLALPAAPRAQSRDDWFGPDKALHFAASVNLSLTGYAAGVRLTEDRGWRLATSLGLSLGAGVTKELVDCAAGGDPSWRDLTWDLLGAAVGALTAWAIDRALGPSR